MRIIAHRANLNGPDSNLENNPSQVDNCIEMGLDVEIDVRYLKQEEQFSLGHDSGDFPVDFKWLMERKKNLWIHCKNLEAMEKLSDYRDELNFFWHQEDSYTLTSKGMIWAYPGSKLNNMSISVMPEWGNENFENELDGEIFGCCTDFPLRLLGRNL